jgi:hypothetical protein
MPTKSPGFKSAKSLKIPRCESSARPIHRQRHIDNLVPKTVSCALKRVPVKGARSGINPLFSAFRRKSRAAPIRPDTALRTAANVA